MSSAPTSSASLAAPAASSVAAGALRSPIFPRSVVAGAGVLLLFTVVVAGAAHRTNQDHVVLAPTRPVAMRDLAFKDLTNGGVAISDAANGRLITIVAPQTGGFVRGIMRGLVRDHRRQDKPLGTSFRLTRWADGRLSIEDPSTRESFELEAFGSTNEQVFARLLDPPDGH